jgi:SAM-dependent methyltransferase
MAYIHCPFIGHCAKGNLSRLPAVNLVHSIVAKATTLLPGASDNVCTKRIWYIESSGVLNLLGNEVVSGIITCILKHYQSIIFTMDGRVENGFSPNLAGKDQGRRKDPKKRDRCPGTGLGEPRNEDIRGKAVRNEKCTLLVGTEKSLLRYLRDFCEKDGLKLPENLVQLDTVDEALNLVNSGRAPECIFVDESLPGAEELEKLDGIKTVMIGSRKIDSFREENSSIDASGSFNNNLMEIAKVLDCSGFRRKRILFAGCPQKLVPGERNRWERLSGLCKGFGVSICRASAEQGVLNKINSDRPPDVIVLGPFVESRGEPVDQIGLFRDIRAQRPDTKIILAYLPDDAQRAINECQDGKTYITDINRSGGTDFIFRRIGDFFRREDQQTEGFKPRIISVGENRVMSPEEAEKADRAMKSFSIAYNDHMDMTGHYPAMLVLLNAFYRHFGNVAMDVACGTGKPMRRFIRNAVISRFRSGQRTEPILVHAVDYKKEMLGQAIKGFSRLLRKEQDVAGRIGMTFSEADFLKMTMDAIDLSGCGMDEKYLDRIDPLTIDTLLVSYFIYWSPDKEATVQQYAKLLPPGGSLITIEEPDLRISQGALNDEAADIIEKGPIVIPLKTYYEMLQDYGFVPAMSVREMPDEMVQQIDGNKDHVMVGKVFYKGFQPEDS